ncbi:MAG: hypothetical protein CFE21_19525 [Bacteroidetes bacterium B1(2017)]|nr:MAG: hypothetical protein CFE21_19525 [Bacteroidetes bacterium B1(2017)]
MTGARKKFSEGRKTLSGGREMLSEGREKFSEEGENFNGRIGMRLGWLALLSETKGLLVWAVL